MFFSGALSSIRAARRLSRSLFRANTRRPFSDNGLLERNGDAERLPKVATTSALDLFLLSNMCAVTSEILWEV